MIAKRCFDLLAAAIGLIVLGPVFVALAVWIAIDSKGPVFFRQIRVGMGGKPFKIHKFRTMRTETQATGLQITVGADQRITRVGHFIRKYKLDELPQLIDVFIGNMSLVGPRPEVPYYVDKYPEPIRATVLSVRPGITDWCSVLYRNESELLASAPNPDLFYTNILIPKKLEYHLNYVKNRSFGGDLLIILRTLTALGSK